MSSKAPRDKSAAKQLRYKLLSQLPGDTGLTYLRKHSLSRKGSVAAGFDAALAAARGKICVDLGANLGVFTRRMAEVASHVHAFEPDPWTAQRLRESLSDTDNVTVIEAAAGDQAGTVMLSRTSGFDADPETASLSSSIISDKAKMDGQTFEVEMIDLTEYLAALDGPIGLLKIDIEGAEVALLEALLDHPVLSRIDSIFVETHETKIPRDLARRSLALRRRVAGLKRPLVEMDWN